MLLDHYRSDTAGVNWRSLEYSDLSPLAREEGKCLQCVTSLAALDLLERKRIADASMLYKVAQAYVIFTSRVRLTGKRAHRHAVLRSVNRTLI